MQFFTHQHGCRRLRRSLVMPLFAGWLLVQCSPTAMRSANAQLPTELPAAAAPAAASLEPTTVLQDPQDSLDAGELVSRGLLPAEHDPLTRAEIETLIESEVNRRLAGIPRPQYLPATDFVPPKGVLLVNTSPSHGQFPFAMTLGGFMQLRWFEFARSKDSWIDSAGNVRPVENINTFNINRFLLALNGHVADERLFYNFALFGTTNVGIRSGVVPIGLAGWKFSDAASIGAGMSIVSATREWTQMNPWTIGVDRSMANTFFRPGFSPGAQASGSLLDGEVRYVAGVWNAIDGGTTGVLRRGTSMAWAGNIWWEPLGPFGLGGSDMEIHDEAAVRLGTTGAYALTNALPIPGNNPEDTVVRLSDGTPLSLPNALGPDSQVDQFVYRLMTVDAAWKWRGVGVAFEYYFRLLDSFQGTGSFERESVYDHGGLAYLSWCLVPRSYEVYARSSVVTGPYGTGQEYGGGMNWYIKQSRQARLTLEALSINKSPAQNFIYPYRAGYTGTAIQTQLVVAF
jgi:hypothetical protein